MALHGGNNLGELRFRDTIWWLLRGVKGSTGMEFNKH